MPVISFGASTARIDMALPIAISSTCVLLSLLFFFPACASQVARLVTAEEITGVVLEGNGKPIANAIVAIRFVRENTGHAARHCFRSIAVQTDAAGRFRFAPWKQENTQANWTNGEITAYKAGYSGPLRPVRVEPSRHSVDGTSYSRDTVDIPKADVRLEMRPFAGNDEDRIGEIRRLVGNFTCRWQAEFDDMILLTSIRNEISSSPIAMQRPRDGGYTALEWINQAIKAR